MILVHHGYAITRASEIRLTFWRVDYTWFIEPNRLMLGWERVLFQMILCLEFNISQNGIDKTIKTHKEHNLEKTNLKKMCSGRIEVPLWRLWFCDAQVNGSACNHASLNNWKMMRGKKTIVASPWSWHFFKCSLVRWKRMGKGKRQTNWNERFQHYGMICFCTVQRRKNYISGHHVFWNFEGAQDWILGGPSGLWLPALHFHNGFCPKNFATFWLCIWSFSCLKSIMLEG